jgi:hypothetical protein
MLRNHENDLGKYQKHRHNVEGTRKRAFGDPPAKVRCQWPSNDDNYTME